MLCSRPGVDSDGRTCPEVSVARVTVASCFSPPVTRTDRPEKRRRRARLDASDVGTDLKEVLIPADRLRERVAELAAQIDADYAGRELLLVGVLKGAVMIMADLARAMRLPVEMDWMAVSSYGSGTRSSGVVRILKD